MARKARVKYWPSRGGYGCWVAGRQQILATGPDDFPGGPTYDAAVKAFAKLIAQETGKGSNDYRVSACLNRFRQHLVDTGSEQRQHFDYLVCGFAEKHGGLRLADLKPYHVTEWLHDQTRWNNSSRRRVGEFITAAINFAVRLGYAESNPLQGKLMLPAATVRGREAALSPALCDLLVAEAYKNRMLYRQFGDLLWALRETGARPREIWRAEAHNFKRDRIVYPWNTTKGYVHKTAKKTRRDRTIYLTDTLAAYVADLAKQHPTGPLFRTARGLVWTRCNISNNWKRLLERPALVRQCEEEGVDRDGLKLYFFRHTAITRWIEDGRSIIIAAKVFGTSVRVIEERYGHPNEDAIHDAYRDFMTPHQRS